MCKIIKNTRWICHLTHQCRPKSRHLSPLELRPRPFISLCDKVDGFTGVCHGEREVIDAASSNSKMFYKSTECPRHHARRMASLEEAWEEEWRVQIVEARPGRSFRRTAEARKEIMTVQREAYLRGLEKDAERYNTDLYAEALAWQYRVVTQVMNELVNNLI